VKTKTRRPRRKKTPTALLIAGAQPEVIREARAAILEILREKGAGDVAKAAAVETLGKLCRAENVTISGCTFESK
jgi:hypothetical protein